MENNLTLSFKAENMSLLGTEIPLLASPNEKLLRHVYQQTSPRPFIVVLLALQNKNKFFLMEKVKIVIDKRMEKNGRVMNEL